MSSYQDYKYELSKFKVWLEGEKKKKYRYFQKDILLSFFFQFWKHYFKVKIFLKIIMYYTK